MKTLVRVSSVSILFWTLSILSFSGAYAQENGDGDLSRIKRINAQFKKMTEFVKTKAALKEALSELELSMPEANHTSTDTLSFKGQLKLAHTVWSNEPTELEAAITFSERPRATEDSPINLDTQYSFELKTDAVKLFGYLSLVVRTYNTDKSLEEVLQKVSDSKSIHELFLNTKDLLVAAQKKYVDIPELGSLIVVATEVAPGKSGEVTQFAVQLSKEVGKVVQIDEEFFIAEPRLLVSSKNVKLNGTLIETSTSDHAYSKRRERILKQLEMGDQSLTDFLATLVSGMVQGIGK